LNEPGGRRREEIDVSERAQRAHDPAPELTLILLEISVVSLKEDLDSVQRSHCCFGLEKRGGGGDQKSACDGGRT